MVRWLKRVSAEAFLVWQLLEILCTRTMVCKMRLLLSSICFFDFSPILWRLLLWRKLYWGHLPLADHIGGARAMMFASLLKLFLALTVHSMSSSSVLTRRQASQRGFYSIWKTLVLNLSTFWLNPALTWTLHKRISVFHANFNTISLECATMKPLQ